MKVHRTIRFFGRLSLSLSLGFLGAQSALGARLEVKEVKASSQAPAVADVSFEAARAADGKLGTYWSEGEASAGLGDWIEFRFAEEVSLTRLVLYPGNWYSGEFFKRNNRIKNVELKFSDGSKERLEFPDKMERRVVVLKAPVRTRSVKLVLKEIYAGSTFNDTHLSEVQFFNDEASSRLEPAKLEATSTLPADSDASYGVANLMDGLLDTPWCEGKPETGIGEQLHITLKEPAALGTLRLLNGVAVTPDTYLKNGRVTRLKIEVEGQAAQEVAVTAPFGEFQDIPLGGLKGTSLTLTVLEAAAGLKFKDTCITELELISATPPSP